MCRTAATLCAKQMNLLNSFIIHLLLFIHINNLKIKEPPEQRND